MNLDLSDQLLAVGAFAIALAVLLLAGLAFGILTAGVELVIAGVLADVGSRRTGAHGDRAESKPGRLEEA